MLREYDRIIIILTAREIERFVPDYLKRSKRVMFWSVGGHMPHSPYVSFPPSTYVPFAKIVASVKGKVDRLIKEIG